MYIELYSSRQTKRGRQGSSEEVCREGGREGGWDGGRKGWREGGRSREGYPEEGIGHYTVLLSHNAALARETLVLQIKNIEQV